MSLVSVIICTYNRAPWLADTLDSLATAVAHAAPPVEILVVNNNSTDNTEAVVRDFMARHPALHVQYVLETHPGLSAARNAGIMAARGDILCFLDDDVLVPATWLPGVLAAFELDPGIGCIAGQIRLAWPEGGAPAWIDERYYPFFSQFICGEDARILSHGEAIYGANFAVQRRVFEAVGHFNPDLGRKKSCLLSGEDTDFSNRVWEHGFTIAYSAAGYVHHRVLPERISFRWLWQRALWAGITRYIMPENHHPFFPLRRLPKLLCSLLSLPFCALTGNRKHVYRALLRLADAFGPFYGQWLEIGRRL